MSQSPGPETELQKVTEELRAARAALASAEDRLSLMIESVKDFSIFSTDPAGVVMSWNTGAERVFGYAEPEILGRSADVLFTPEDRAAGAPDAERQQALEIGRGEDERWHVRGDGSLFYASGIVTPIVDHEGTLRDFTKVARDMTASKLAAEEREQLLAREKAAREEAEVANKAKDQFLASLSHELRTPLTPVLLTACTLRADETLPAAIRDDLGLICANIELEARLIDDLLDITRIETGKLHLDFAVVELHDLVRETLSILESESGRKTLSIEVDLAAEQPHVCADHSRLKQVIWNVLKNAIKFTPADGRITLQTRNRDGLVELTISDTGIGIPAHVLPKLFDLFEQGSLATSKQFGGVGLGMAISRAIMEMHGGEIRAESRGQGEGATFTISLAVARPTKDGEVDPPSPVTKVCTGLRVLLVEDHEPTAFVLTRLLKKRGHHVTVANTITEARAQVTRLPDLNLIISDIGLPDGSGHDLLREVRGLARELPAIAISGYGMEKDMARSADSGFTEHLTKPVDMQKVDAPIYRLCGDICRQVEVQ